MRLDPMLGDDFRRHQARRSTTDDRRIFMHLAIIKRNSPSPGSFSDHFSLFVMFYRSALNTFPTAFNFKVHVLPVWNCWNSLTEPGE